MQSRVLAYLAIFLTIVLSAKCARILGIFHVPGISHYRAGVNLMKILAAKGHHVTVVSPFGEKSPSENYTDIVLSGLYDEKMMEQKMQPENFIKSRWHAIVDPFIISTVMGQMEEETLKHEEFRKLIHSKNEYDLVIVEEFGSLALRYVAHRFKAPLILYSGLELNYFVNNFVGNIWSPSYMTHFHTESLSEMTFAERIENVIYYISYQMSLHFMMIPNQNKALQKYFPEAPAINEFAYNISLAFVNSDLSITDALPTVPNIVSIGGYHIKPPQPLPADLQKLMDNAENGVIYFSLGSNMKGKYIPREKKEMMIRVFSKLKQTILWKLEEDFPGLPENVVIRKWFPQNDILAHKNLKVFITHGGIYSLLEAINIGIPLLAFPLFGDQEANVKRAVSKGFAKGLDFHNFEENEFEDALLDLLHDTKYTEAARRSSEIMRHKLNTPEESILFWIDYLLKHKDAKHLRVAAAKLFWYQYMLLDVSLFLVGFIIVNVIVFVYIFKLSLSFVKNGISLRHKVD